MKNSFFLTLFFALLSFSAAAQQQITADGWYRVASTSEIDADGTLHLIDLNAGDTLSIYTALSRTSISNQKRTIYLRGEQFYSPNIFTEFRYLQKSVNDPVYLDVYIKVSGTESCDLTVESGTLNALDLGGLTPSTVPADYKSVPYDVAGLQFETFVYAPLERGQPGSSIGDADADPTNELQSLSLSNDTLYLSDGNFVVLPAQAATNAYLNGLNYAADEVKLGGDLVENTTVNLANFDLSITTGDFGIILDPGVTIERNFTSTTGDKYIFNKGAPEFNRNVESSIGEFHQRIIPGNKVETAFKADGSIGSRQIVDADGVTNYAATPSEVFYGVQTNSSHTLMSYRDDNGALQELRLNPNGLFYRDGNSVAAEGTFLISESGDGFYKYSPYSLPTMPGAEGTVLTFDANGNLVSAPVSANPFPIVDPNYAGSFVDFHSDYDNPKDWTHDGTAQSGLTYGFNVVAGDFPSSFMLGFNEDDQFALEGSQNLTVLSGLDIRGGLIISQQSYVGSTESPNNINLSSNRLFAGTANGDFQPLEFYIEPGETVVGYLDNGKKRIESRQLKAEEIDWSTVASGTRLQPDNAAAFTALGAGKVWVANGNGTPAKGAVFVTYNPGTTQ